MAHYYSFSFNVCRYINELGVGMGPFIPVLGDS